AVLAALRLEVTLVPEIDQRVQAFIGREPHAAAVAAVTTVGSPERNELLATEAGTAVPAVAGLHLDDGFVDKLHGGLDREPETGNAAHGTGTHSLPVPCSPFPLFEQTKSPALGGAFRLNVTRASARDHVHRALALGALDGKLHLAIDQREQGVVAAQADADARMELGAALADDDVAGFDGLAAEQLDAQIFRVGVAAVARGTYALFVCHGGFSLLAATGDAG